MSLIEKIRKARESVVEVDGKKFTIRRPTEAEQAQMFSAGASQLELVRQCVVGWNLKEIDLIPGGDPVDATFSTALWVEYVDDNSELWQPLREAIKDSIQSHNAEVERAVKK
jgi:hypothetical protein